MPLPLSISGRVKVVAQSAVPPKAAASRLERGLEILKATRIDRAGTRIHFTVRANRMVLNTNLLTPINSGELEVNSHDGNLIIFYSLRFTRLLVASGLVLVLFGPILLSTPNQSIESVSLLMGVWSFLFGGNLVIALFRFRRWIRRTIDTRPHVGHER